jgi:hypothetical protein
MTATITFRKTQRGEWAVCGPVSAVREGTEVTVTKRSGDTKRVYIERVGRQFQRDGKAMVYGYIGSDRNVETTSTGRGGICDECDQPRRNLRPCVDSSGIGGMCCPRCASMSPFERSFC